MMIQRLVSLCCNHRFRCCDFPPWVSQYDKLLGCPREIAKQSRIERGAITVGLALCCALTMQRAWVGPQLDSKKKKIPARMMRRMTGTPFPSNHHFHHSMLLTTTHPSAHPLGQGLGFSVNVRYDRPRACLHLLFIAIFGVGKKKLFPSPMRQ